MTVDATMLAKLCFPREIAEGLTETFESCGGVNYVAIEFTRPYDCEKFEMILQKKSGKTPATLYAESQAEIKRLRSWLEEIKAESVWGDPGYEVTLKNKLGRIYEDVERALKGEPID